jgi:transposase-like protein
MKVECPHCNTDNVIEYAEHISCEKCEKSFKGFKFSKRKLVSASTALFVGVVGGYKVNSAFDEERYPLEVEYAIIAASTQQRIWCR